ncbi:hypothetical protein L6R53_06905 [Myxococcota bacterium]|nr:hypothetical protein [Myxococcota bacterium]
MRPGARPALAAVALVAAALVALACRLGAHLGGVTAGTGSDPDLWVFASVDAAHGAGWPLPPLGPLLVAGLASIGLPWHGAWLLLSAVALPLTAGLAALLAGRLGATPALSLAAGLGLLALPVLASTAWQAGPDALTALAFLAAAAGAQQVAAAGPRPSPGACAGAGVGLGAAILARELGPVVAAGAALGIAARAALPPRWRLLGPALLLLGAALPAALLADAIAPWDWRWLGRVARDSQDLPPPQVPAWVLDAQGLHRLLRRAAWTLQRHPEGWLTLALGAAAALRRRWWALALAQASGLAALGVWSQPRHVAVLLPISVAALAGWTALASRRERALALLLVVGVTAAGGLRWKGALALAREEAAETAALASLGAELCAAAAPGDLAAGEPRAFLFCPLPRHAPRRAPPERGHAAADPVVADAAAWASWTAGTPPGDLPWEPVPLQSRRFDLYRLRPDLRGTARPCAGSAPRADTPAFPSPPLPATMDPPCEAPVEPASPRHERQRLRHLRTTPADRAPPGPAGPD